MKRKIFFLSLIILIIFINITLLVFADDITATDDITTTFVIENPLGSSTSDIYSLTDKFTNILIHLATVITPIIIVYAGFLYITAMGNEKKVETAQKILVWALLGFALVLIATGIPNLIKEFLIGSKTSDSINNNYTETCLNSGGNCCGPLETCDGQILGPCDNDGTCCNGVCIAQ